MPIRWLARSSTLISLVSFGSLVCLLGLAAGGAGCGSVGGGTNNDAGVDRPAGPTDTGGDGGQPDTPPVVDAGSEPFREDAPVPVDSRDAGGGACSAGTPFSGITLVPGLNSAMSEDALSFSPDGLVVWFSSNRTPTVGLFDIWTATRTSVNEPFATPMPVGGVNTATQDRGPRISGDGLRLYFVSNRVVANGFDIMIATRSTTVATFGTPAAVANVNTISTEDDPFLTPDESALYFVSNRAGGLGGLDIYVSTVAAGGSFGPPRLISELSSTAADSAPVLSSDGLTMYFASTRVATTGENIYVATRTTVNDGFGQPTPVAELNGPAAANDSPLFLSSDGCVIWFSSNRPMGDAAATGNHLYSARR